MIRLAIAFGVRNSFFPIARQESFLADDGEVDLDFGNCLCAEIRCSQFNGGGWQTGSGDWNREIRVRAVREIESPMG